ncbi:hypothetical protein BJX68DRAFT_270430 [Aspergillus pseudodeflectus]|uniref:DUF6594 domain-containing protein n=1 Tax=Aspergillus pseudodeflectus TaxID=176178 RepID=A0ABR4JRX1_9EURO
MDTRHTHATQSPDRGQDTTDVEKAEKLAKDKRAKKDIGYAGYVELIASADNFWIFRRFDRLNARVMLSMQDEIVDLEQNLDAVDKTAAAEAGDDVNNGTFRNDTNARRRSLVHTAREKLGNYYRHVYYYSQMRQHHDADPKHVDNTIAWFDVQGSAIDDAEKAYLSQDDAVALVSMQSSPLRRFLERWPAFRLFRQWRKFVHSPTLENVQYRDPDKIECFVKLITVSFVLIMLIAPLWVLMYLETTTMKLLVNTVFTAFFLVMLSYVSNARTQEAVAATAGYCAVLMVVMQIQAEISR